MPKLSIITVNYNNYHGLKKTIKSVVEQTWQEFEFLIIDGGSTDESVSYIKSESGRIDYWVSEPDTGVYNAMNKGIKKAKGEYLLFLNSGDHFYDKHVLKRNRSVLDLTDIIYFNLNVVEGQKQFIKKYPNELSFAFFVKDTLPHPATFIKREAFFKTSFYDDHLKISADWKFFINGICKHQLTYKKVEDTLSTFYIGGMSSDPANSKIKSIEREDLLTKQYPAYLYDLEDVLEYQSIINNLRNSRIISTLIKFKVLNKF